MNDLEEQIRQEFRRVDPGARFTDAVMARVAVERRSGWQLLRGGRGQRAVLWAAAAALVVASVGGYGLERRSAEERRVGELAQQRFALAMRLTGRTLSHVDREVSMAGRRE